MKKGGIKSQSIVLLFLCAVLCLAAFLGAMQHDLSAAGTEQVRRIGAVYMTMNNPFYAVIDNQVALKVDSEGDLLLTRDPAMSQERQNEQIRELLREDIDLLIVTPVDSKAVVPVIREVHEAGVPIIVVDSQIDDSSLAACTIVSDNYGAGVLCAQHLMEQLDSARIFLLEHAGANSGNARIRGFCSALAGKSRYTIAARAETMGQLEISMPQTEKMISENGTPDVIMALNDPSALGAVEALETMQAGGHTLVYGVDGTPEAKAMIKEGIMTATAAQSVYEIGRLVGDTAYQLLNGEDYPTEIVVPVQLITAENVEEFDIYGWQ